MKIKTLILFIGLLCIFSCGKQFSNKKQPLAEKGVLDLRDWDFAKDGPVKLNGEWDFFWKKFVLPNEIKKATPWVAKVPLSWNSQRINDKELPGYGYATYHLKILMKPVISNLALKFETIGTAYECFLNGKKILSVGKVGTNADSSIPKYAPAVVEFNENKDVFDLVFHVSNFDHKSGGIWYSILFADSKRIFELKESNLNIDFLVFGISIIMFLYYIGMVILRPKEKLVLYFALFCILIGLRVAVSGEMALIQQFPFLSYEFNIKIQYLTFYLLSVAFFQFLYFSFPEDYHKKIIHFITFFYVTNSIIVIFTSASFFSTLIIYAQLLYLIIISYSLIMSVIIVTRKRNGSILMLLGVVFITFAAANDILYAMEVIDSKFLISFSFIFMILIHSQMISLRFSRAFNSIDDLSKKLDKKNIELNELNINLEKKVEERTEELHKSEGKLRSFLENANDIIFRTDWKGNFYFVNKITEEKTGYTSEELQKMNYRDLIHPDYKEKVYELYRNHLKNKLEKSFQEFPLQTKSGEVIWVWQSATAIKDDDGNIIEFDCIVRDITDRKKAEKELENANTKLIKYSVEVDQANEKLKELDRLKTNFFANISHEIRTPLTLILSPVESVIQDGYKKKVGKDFFDNIQKNAIRLLRLVNNILDFSKIEAGKMSMKIREVDIVQVMRNYIGTIQLSAESKSIDLSFQTICDSLLLYLDIEKTDKIGMNLFSNALKFTEKGGKIEVSIREDENNCYIDFEDTGEGIPGNMLASIFDRFSQADGSSTRQYEGTGIGLSLVKELVEMHSGSISVQSKYIDEYPDEHGTTFTVTFKKGKIHFENRPEVEFITDSELEESVSKQRRFMGMREMIDLKESDAQILETRDESNQVGEQYNINILIVEDNADMRNFLKSLVENIYKVHFAVDGLDGLEKARGLHPDLIITDVMMPNMDGYQMTQTLKEDEQLKRIPVLMLTAKAEIAYKIEGLEYGADDYLTKPFNSKELLVRMKNLLQNREYEKIIYDRNMVIEDELETAKLLQQKLLPEEIPEVSGYKSHVVYIPMDKIGGDFYDFKSNNKMIELLIADVSGHGLPGAFLSMIAKMAFESIRERESTRNVLYLMNDVIYRSTVKNNYITTFYGHLDRNTNILTYSNAGHFPPLVYRKGSDEFFELKAKGTPLGWFKGLDLEENEMQLKRGDRLLLYTDGITECINDKGKEFADKGFKKFIKNNIKLSPEKFSDKLLKHLKEFSGRDRFDDDLCLVVVDVGGDDKVG